MLSFWFCYCDINEFKQSIETQTAGCLKEYSGTITVRWSQEYFEFNFFWVSCSGVGYGPLKGFSVKDSGGVSEVIIIIYKAGLVLRNKRYKIDIEYMISDTSVLFSCFSSATDCHVVTRLRMVLFKPILEPRVSQKPPLPPQGRGDVCFPDSTCGTVLGILL